MNKNKLLGGIIALSLLPIKTLAFCPMCVIATGLLTGAARWLGVDDTIIGLWLGGFITSLTVVLNNFLISKNKKIRFQLPLMLLFIYGLIVTGLYLDNTLSSFNKFLGVNKIILGIIIGNALLIITPYLDKLLRNRNQGKIFVSHQKVIIVIGLLFVFSLIFFFLTR